MKRRLLMAKAMVLKPPILVLDEPTAGVDVELRQQLWNNVKELNKKGVTIILTTHYLFEAQKICNRIAILNKGNLIALDSTKNLLERIETKKIFFKVKNKNKFIEKNINDIRFSFGPHDEIIATYNKKKHKIEEVINVVKSKGVEIDDISTEEGDLEDVFIQLTKN